MDKNFISGFVSGEGCFYTSISKNMKTVTCGLVIGVRIDDKELLKDIWRELDYPGSIYVIDSHRYKYEWDKIERRSSIRLVIRKQHDIATKIIPFFDVYKLHGRKLRSYTIWKQVVQATQCKPINIAQIIDMQAEMNKYVDVV